MPHVFDVYKIMRGLTESKNTHEQINEATWRVAIDQLLLLLFTYRPDGAPTGQTQLDPDHSQVFCRWVTMPFGVSHDS